MHAERIALTTVRLDALRLVEAGQLEYSLSTGSWEPKVGYRLPAFAWLEERGLIEPEYGAEPQGHVTQRVPVLVTPAGHAALDEARA